MRDVGLADKSQDASDGNSGVASRNDARPCLGRGRADASPEQSVRIEGWDVDGAEQG